MVALPETAGVQAYTRSGDNPVLAQVPLIELAPLVVPMNVPPCGGRVATAAHAVHPLVVSPPTHTPPLHASTEVHALPSLHAALLYACKQPTWGSQMSSVQGWPSSQLSG